MPRRANPYSRVTTVLDSLNAGWKYFWLKSVGFEECDRIGKESTEFGRQVHKGVENYLIGTAIEKPLTERQQFCANLDIKWLKEAKSVPLQIEGKPAVELELKSEKYKLVGHPDYINYISGTLWIIDWKTSKESRLEYPLQMAAYTMMLEEQHGIKCNDGAILRTPSDPNVFPQFEVHEYHNLKEKYLPLFLNGLSLYNYFNNKAEWKKVK